jgi:hypothetical protein
VVVSSSPHSSYSTSREMIENDTAGIKYNDTAGMGSRLEQGIIHSRDFKHLSRVSIQAECNAIFYFCERNDLVLNKKKIERFIPPDESAHDDRLYTDGEMQRIISECNKREKVIILLMLAGGVRIGTISKLKVKNLEPITVN